MIGREIEVKIDTEVRLDCHQWVLCRLRKGGEKLLNEGRRLLRSAIIPHTSASA